MVQLYFFISIVFLLLYVGYLLRLFKTRRKLGLYPRKYGIKLFSRASVLIVLLIATYRYEYYGQQSALLNSKDQVGVLVIDVSPSMRTEDIAPSRLEKAQFLMSDILKKTETTSVGMFSFSSNIKINSPVSDDKTHLFTQIQLLETVNSGTDLKKIFQTVFDKLKTFSGRKWMILISDGEFHEALPDEEPEIFKQNGIRVYTVGIGTKGGDHVPQGSDFLRDNTGKPVVSRLEDETLKRIAENTQGEYFEISDLRNESQELIERINQDHKVLNKDQYRFENTLNLVLLLLALLGIFFDILITVRVVR